MSDKNLISMMHAAMKGDSLAASQLNDVFEDNGLDKCKFPELLLLETGSYSNNALVMASIVEVDGMISPAYEKPTSESLKYHYNLEHIDGGDWVNRAEVWYEICKMYNLPIGKIQTPQDWDFEKEDFEGDWGKALTEFFTKICIEPIHRWWNE